MADDLEAFLRQVAQRRAGDKKTPQTQQDPKEPSSARPRSAQPENRSTTSNDQVVEAEVVSSRAAPLEKKTSQRTEDQLSNLSQEGARKTTHGKPGTEEELEAHVHETFDHRVGAFDAEAGMPKRRNPGSEDAGSPAADIAKLLANPQSLRHAIILSEILSRPHIDW